jgi:hypothetical protein
VSVLLRWVVPDVLDLASPDAHGGWYWMDQFERLVASGRWT